MVGLGPGGPAQGGDPRVSAGGGVKVSPMCWCLVCEGAREGDRGLSAWLVASTAPDPRVRVPPSSWLTQGMTSAWRDLPCPSFKDTPWPGGHPAALLCPLSPLD